MPVDRSRRKTVPRQRELQSGDVPAAPAEDERPAPERGEARVAAERSSGLRAGNTVGGQPLPELKAPHGHRSGGTENSVHRARIEAVRAKRNLQRSDLRVAGRM